MYIVVLYHTLSFYLVFTDVVSGKWTQEEILKDLQLLDEINLDDSKINDFDEDEERAPQKSNYIDDESENNSQHDSKCDESNSLDNECSETKKSFCK